MEENIFELQVDDHLLLLRPQRQRLFLLNAAAALIWEAKTVTDGTQAGINALVRHYDISPEIAEADVRATLESWRATGLIGDPEEGTSEQATRRGPFFLFGTTRHYRLGEFTFAITLDDPQLEEDLLPRVAHLECPAPAKINCYYAIQRQDDCWAVWRRGQEISVEESPFKARLMLLHDLIEQALRHDTFCVLHAAVIAQGGRCVVAAGESGAGKSTLAVAAMQAGLQCPGDDGAPITCEGGRVAATPFGIMLRESSWPFFPQLEQSLSPTYTRETGRVRFLAPSFSNSLETFQPAALVFLDRRAGEPAGLTPLSRIEAIARLHATGFWVVPECEAVAAWLEWLERTPKYLMHYADSETGVQLLKDLLAF